VPQVDDRYSDISKIMENTIDYVGALDRLIHDKAGMRRRPRTTLDQDNRTAGAAAFEDADAYRAQREEVLAREGVLAFDYRCRTTASARERQVDDIIQALKRKDEAEVYNRAPQRVGWGGQLHPRFPGDHFLSNADLIAQTDLFRVARRMPKGAHLHIHFNACLLPTVLLEVAKGMDRMFITSDIPLVGRGDNDFTNFDRCEIQFSILPPESERPGDLFEQEYVARQTMKFKEFIRIFPTKYGKCSVDEWLYQKLIFHEEEAYNLLQTAEG